MIYAAINGYLDIIKYLIEHYGDELDINVKNIVSEYFLM